MFISDYFHKFWMSCACRDQSAKDEPKWGQALADRPTLRPAGRAPSRLASPLHQCVTQAQEMIVHVELRVGLIKGPERPWGFTKPPDFRPYDTKPTQAPAEPTSGGDLRRPCEGRSRGWPGAGRSAAIGPAGPPPGRFFGSSGIALISFTCFVHLPLFK